MRRRARTSAETGSGAACASMSAAGGSKAAPRSGLQVEAPAPGQLLSTSAESGLSSGRGFKSFARFGRPRESSSSSSASLKSDKPERARRERLGHREVIDGHVVYKKTGMEELTEAIQRGIRQAVRARSAARRRSPRRPRASAAAEVAAAPFPPSPRAHVARWG